MKFLYSLSVNTNVCISGGRKQPSSLGREHLRPQNGWRREEHYDILSLRTASGASLQRENTLVWQSKTAASTFCFTYCCIFCDPLDYFYHRAAREGPSFCIFHTKHLVAIPIHFKGRQMPKRKKIGSIYTTLNFLTSLHQKTPLRAERQARVEKICNTYKWQRTRVFIYIRMSNMKFWHSIIFEVQKWQFILNILKFLQISRTVQ